MARNSWVRTSRIPVMMLSETSRLPSAFAVESSGVCGQDGARKEADLATFVGDLRPRVTEGPPGGASPARRRPKPPP